MRKHAYISKSSGMLRDVVIDINRGIARGVNELGSVITMNVSQFKYLYKAVK